MMFRWSARFLVGLSALTLVTACGDDDVDPRDRCSDDVAYFVSGNFVVNGESSQKFEFENEGASLPAGAIRSGAVLLNVGNVKRSGDAPPLLLKFAENVDTSDLLDQFANQTADGAKTFAVADGSGVPSDAVRRSDLTLVECGMSDGTLCAQLALDTTGEGTVGDDDEKVFAATGGEIRIVDVDNNRSRVLLDFAIDLGTNVLTTGDASTGRIAGCINAKYDSLGGAAGWSLE